MRFMSLAVAAAITLNPIGVAAQAEDQVGPLIDYGTRFLPAIAAKGMVAGPEELASEAGLAMLKIGGNAIDAAVATGFALAVTAWQRHGSGATTASQLRDNNKATAW